MTISISILILTLACKLLLILYLKINGYGFVTNITKFGLSLVALNSAEIVLQSSSVHLPAVASIIIYAMVLVFSAILIFNPTYQTASPQTKLGHYLVSKRRLTIVLFFSPLIAFSALTYSVYFVPAIVAISTATTGLLGIMIYVHRPERLVPLLSHLPFTHEYRLRKQSMRQFYPPIRKLFSSNKGISLLEQRLIFELNIIQYALNITTGNKEQAAKLLQISRATIHRKIKQATS